MYFPAIAPILVLLASLSLNHAYTLNYSIVMSAGDSITAGLGARWSYIRPTLFVYEDCGVSFATGGDEDIVSIAKLIEEDYGGEVAGKSFGSRRVNLCIDRPTNRVFCPRDPIRLRRKTDGYNVAMTGATSEALPLQYSELIKRVEEDGLSFSPLRSRILLTVLIGANDLCMWDCRRPSTQYESFRSHLTQFITKIYSYFGDSVDILLSEIPALEGIPIRSNGSVMEPFAVLECPCAYHPDKSYSFATRIEMYNQVIRSLAPAVHLVTNVLRREELKDWSPEMTSKLDAFHPSKWAHGYFAKKIFNELKSFD